MDAIFEILNAPIPNFQWLVVFLSIKILLLSLKVFAGNFYFLLKIIYFILVFNHTINRIGGNSFFLSFKI